MNQDEVLKPFENTNCIPNELYLNSHGMFEQLAITNMKTDYTLPLTSSSKSKQFERTKDIRIINNYNNIIDNPSLLNAVYKQKENAEIKNATDNVKSFYNNLDNYFDNKFDFFEKHFINKYGYYDNKPCMNANENKLKGNKIQFTNNLLLKQYSLNSMLLMESFPGLKPSSNWPISVDELLDKLKEVKLEELFHQPVDDNNKQQFVNEALQAILMFDNEGNNQFLIKGVIALVIMLLLFGDFILLYDSVCQLKMKLSSNAKSLLKVLFNKENSDTLMDVKCEYKYILMFKEKIKELFMIVKENNFTPYPIMRNYSIIDYFNITANLFCDSFSSNNHSICSDGTYIYVIISGTDGCKLKIGSGYKDTIKGKVYLHVPMNDKGLFHWVYCNNKLYMKSLSSKDVGGCLTVINTQTLQNESVVRLSFPKNCLHSSIKAKNANYVLLSDGKCLSVLLIEPESSDAYGNKHKKTNTINDALNEDEQIIQEETAKQLKQGTLQQVSNTNTTSNSSNNNNSHFSYLKLILITYSNTDPNVINEYKEGSIEKELIDEIYESFCGTFTKYECYKALIKNNWDPMKTSLYLVDNSEEIKQGLLLGETPLVLFQCKIKGVKSGEENFDMQENPIFDVYHFDSLKWVLTNEYIIAYKFREGACAIFNKSPINDNEGTLIKKCNAVVFQNENPEICYDHQQKVYFILKGTQFLNESIVILDTFINPSKSYLSLFNINTSTLNEYFLSFINDKEDIDITFDNFMDNLLTLTLIQGTIKKPDSYWRYKNWDYYYSYLQEESTKINESTSGTRYKQPFLIDNTIRNISNKTFKMRVDKYSMKNINTILNQLPPEINSHNYKLVDVIHIKDDYVSKKRYRNQNALPDINQMNWCYWVSKSGIMIKPTNTRKRDRKDYKKKQMKQQQTNINTISYKLNGKVNEYNKMLFKSLTNKRVFLDNKIYHYFAIDGELHSLSYLVSSLSNAYNAKNYNDVAMCLRLIYVWMLNANLSLLFVNENAFISLISQLKVVINDILAIQSNEYNDIVNIHHIILLVLIEGWEMLYSDNNIEEQLHIMKLFLSYENNNTHTNIHYMFTPNIQNNIRCYYNKCPLLLLFQKTNLSNAGVIFMNSFDQVNLIKAYTFFPLKYNGEYRLLANYLSYGLTRKNIQIPFCIHSSIHLLNKLLLKQPSLDTLEFDVQDPNNSKKYIGGSYRNYTPSIKQMALDCLSGNITLKELLLKDKVVVTSNETSINKLLCEFINTNSLNNNIIEFLINTLLSFFSDVSHIKHKLHPNTLLLNEYYFILSKIIYDIYIHLLPIIKSSLTSIQSVHLIRIFVNFIMANFDVSKYTNLLLIINELYALYYPSQWHQCKCLNQPGSQIEAAQIFEYTLSTTEKINIEREIQFNCDTIGVIIEHKGNTSGDRCLNQDILIKSEDDSSYNSNTIRYGGGYFGRLGTYFKIDIGYSTKKNIFLKGNKIKIISPSIQSTTSYTSYKTVSRKTKLKIIVFPYNKQLFKYDKKILTQYNNAPHMYDFYNELLLTTYDLEYCVSKIYRNVFKQDVNVSKCEIELLKKYPIMYLGLNDYNVDLNIHNEGIAKELEYVGSNIDCEYLRVVLDQIKANNQEPFVYKQLKLRRTFTNEVKVMWYRMELMVLNVLVHHLGLNKSFKTLKMVIVEPFMNYLGKKLNAVLEYLSVRVPIIKESYEMQIEDIEEVKVEYENELNKIKSEIIKTYITNGGNTNNDNNDNSKDNSNNTNTTTTTTTMNASSQQHEHTKYYKHKDKQKYLENKFISKDDAAYKKKRKQYKSSYYNNSQKSTKKDNNNLIENTNTEPTIFFSNKKDYNLYTLNELLSLPEFSNVNITPYKEQIESLFKTFHQNILKKRKERYRNNTETLRILCEHHNIQFNESNPTSTIECLSEITSSKLPSITTSSCFTLSPTLTSLINDISSLNPYIDIIHTLIPKLILLKSLRNFDPSSSYITNITNIDRLSSLHRENSRTHSTSSSVRTKSKHEEEDTALVDHTLQKIIKLIMNFIFKPNTPIEQLIHLLQTQNTTALTRAKCIEMLICDLNKQQQYHSVSSLLNGIISTYIHNDILNGIETTTIFNHKDNIINLLKVFHYSIEQFNTFVNEFKDTQQQQQHNYTVQPLRQIKSYNSNTHLDVHSLLILCYNNIYICLSDIVIILEHLMKQYKSSFHIEINTTLVKEFISLGFDFLFFNKTTTPYVKERINSHKLSKNISELFLITTRKISEIETNCIFEYVLDILSRKLSLLLTTVSNVNDNEKKINDILDIINKMILPNKEHKYVSELHSMLMNLIESSNKYDIVSKSANIIISLSSNSNDVSSGSSSNNNKSSLVKFNKLFYKIGKLFLFGQTEVVNTMSINESLCNIEKEFNDKTKNDKYYVIIQMNSTDIDYQFLINALFYWEEKEFLNDINSVNDDNTTTTNTEGTRVKKKKWLRVRDNGLAQITKFNYFSNLAHPTSKSEIHKMSEIEKIINDKINETQKQIIESLKTSSSPDTTTSSMYKNELHYFEHIKSIIKTAENIGEIASIRGYAVLQPSLTRQDAQSLSELIHKAINKQLPHFSSSIINANAPPLFNDDLIYPAMPTSSKLRPGCINILKETTKNFVNVTIIRKPEFNRFEQNLKCFETKLKKRNVIERRTSETCQRYNNNYLLGCSKSTILSINYNDVPLNQKVINTSITSGTSVSMLIECLIKLIYTLYNNKPSIVRDFGMMFRNIRTDYTTQTAFDKVTHLGLLIVMCDYFKTLRKYSKAISNKEVYTIINGGDKCGQSFSNVLMVQQKPTHQSFKVETIHNNMLTKLDNNKRILQGIPLKDIIDNVNFVFDIYNTEHKDNTNGKRLTYHKLLLHFMLRLLNEKVIESSDIMNYMKHHEESFQKFLTVLSTYSAETKWLEKDDHFLETEFVETFERIYNIIDSSSLLIFSPTCNNELHNESANCESNLHNKNNSITDASGNNIILNYNLPETNYVKQLPRLTDMSKRNSSLKNLIIFERYFVGEIFAYCTVHYKPHDYKHSLHQIRGRLSNGMVADAINDIHNVFDTRKTPVHVPLPKEQYDPKEITKEEIYPGNYYLAKLNNKCIHFAGINTLKKLSTIGVYEVPVLVLLQDNAIKQALVLYIDDENNKAVTFWVNSDNLMFLETQIKFPSNPFELSLIVNEYTYLEKRLRVLYAKNILNKIMICLASNNKISNFDELLNMLILNNWVEFKHNLSAVFHKFNNYITVRKSETLMKLIEEKKESNFTDGIAVSINDSLSSLTKILIDTNHSTLSNNNITISKSTSLDKLISNININSVSSSSPSNSVLMHLLQWCLSNWNNLTRNFKSIHVNLFSQYMTTNANNNTVIIKNKFHLGNFTNKLIALHELFSINTSNTQNNQNCGMIITFHKNAVLGPHAKLSFYSDPYGGELITEINSFKTQTPNLETVVFNYSKIWMHYTPGTRAFYIEDWDKETRDSDLPCVLTLIPYTWSPLINFTDYCTSALFNEIEYNGVDMYKQLINSLISNCISTTLPAEIQRRIFTITNRTILKYSTFISLLQKKGNVVFSSMSLQEKFTYLGIPERSLIMMIQTINGFTVENKDKSLSSAYVVEGVEVLLSIFSVLDVTYVSLESYLKEHLQYELPLWIEAIIKLGQFLNYMQGNSQLDCNIINEIKEQNKLSSNNIILIQYSDNACGDEVYGSVMKIINEHNVSVVNEKCDVINMKELKCVGVVIDGFEYNDKIRKNGDDNSKEEDEKEEENMFWLCFYCKMENDKDNMSCVFCDKNKKEAPQVKVPKKAKRKESLADNQNKSISSDIEKLKQMINAIKSITNVVAVHQADITTTNNDNTQLTLLQHFLYDRTLSYMNKEQDYFNNQLQLINNMNTALAHAIRSISLETSIQVYNDMLTNNIDLWFEHFDIIPHSININLSLMEKIRYEIDKRIANFSKYSLILPTSSLRIMPLSFNPIHKHNLLSLRNVPINIIRYYWTIIKYFNTCLVEAIRYIKPPDYYLTSVRDVACDDDNDNDNYINIPFPQTISSFLSMARGIIFACMKNDLIAEILHATEFTEQEVQAPTFKFERLTIASSFDNKNQKMEQQQPLSNDEENKPQLEVTANESIFLQALSQANQVDVAFFRGQKPGEGDPHVAFKVEFKGELVEGLGGPYRQFFSDVSHELNTVLKLLSPTPNNLSQKGEYKDRYTLTSTYASNEALNQYEFLGKLMGICIRTGVHLTLDLCSIVWKKIINEKITEDDIFQYDEGLYNMINVLTKKDLTLEEFNEHFEGGLVLNDDNTSSNNVKECITYDSNMKLKLKYINQVLTLKLTECDIQINAIRKGLCSIIPVSLLKLITHSELEVLICGEKNVDIDLLKLNTNLSGDLTENSQNVKWLWEILREITDEERVKFIKFCWAQERLPHTNEEFEKHQVRFTIKPLSTTTNAKNKVDIFPRANTCFFHLELPEYTSKDKMKEKILQAINLDNVGMNGDKLSADVVRDYMNTLNRRNNHIENADEYDYDNDY